MTEYSKAYQSRRGKTRTCKSCKNKFERRRDNQVVCSPECAYAYTKTLSERKRKREAINDRKRIREEKEKIKSLGQLKSDLQIVINQIVRILDKDYPCIARPGEPTLRFDAGHFYSVAAYPSLRFHLDNIHKQSSNSNQFKGGDELAYERGLIERYGKVYVDQIKSLRLKYPTLGATKEDVRRWIKTAKKIRARLRKGEEMTRDQVNKEMGIYESKV